VTTDVEGQHGQPGMPSPLPERTRRADTPDAGSDHPGVLGRLGQAAAGRFRLTLALWLVVIAGLGALAPQAVKSLAGAGWQANGSDSCRSAPSSATTSAGPAPPRFRSW
jgi:hypothetical protein